MSLKVEACSELKDSGDSCLPKNNLHETIVVYRSSGRNLPPVEPHKPARGPVSTLVFNDHGTYLKKVAAREADFYSGFGVKKPEKILAYNPIFDLVNIEMAETAEERFLTRLRILKDQQTNLRERYHAAVSIIKYVLDDEGIAYGENLQVPADVIFERGALARIRQGSDPVRELATVEGGIKAKKKLAQKSTPLGSKMIVISGPGTGSNSPYTDNFVDIYESQIDAFTGKKVIMMTRFASSLSYQEYRTATDSLQAGYSDKENGPIDSYFLANPIFIDGENEPRNSVELFREHFASQKEAIGEEAMQEILSSAMPFILNYTEIVSSQASKAEDVAKAFNAVLNYADYIRKRIANKAKGVFKTIQNAFGKAAETIKDVKKAAEFWGRKAVKRVMGGCGSSEGISLGGVNSIINSVSLAISSISGSFFKDKDYCIRCGACGEEIRCVVRKGEACPKCQAVRRC